MTTPTPEQFMLWFQVNYPALGPQFHAPKIYRAAIAGFREEHERLKEVNGELLEACKIMHAMLTERGYGGLAGTMLGDKAIQKADGHCDREGR